MTVISQTAQPFYE